MSNIEPQNDKTAELLKKVRKIEIKTKGLTNQVFSGEYHSAFKGRGMSFSEVRAYQYGDDIRNIDWNVTARTGEPRALRAGRVGAGRLRLGALRCRGPGRRSGDLGRAASWRGRRNLGARGSGHGRLLAQSGADRTGVRCGVGGSGFRRSAWALVADRGHRRDLRRGIIRDRTDQRSVDRRRPKPLSR